MSTRPTVRIGVFVPYGSQLLDLATVDVLGSMSYAYLSGLNMLPEAVYSAAPDVTISYISTVPAGQPVPNMTAQIQLLATHNLADPAVAPGNLNIVLIPGPDPFVEVGEDVKNWLAGHAKCETTDVLSVCTGIFLCGEAGILMGKKASGPRFVQDIIRKKFPGVELVGHEVRWVQDGNLWSSGGVTNGNDLVAAYARASKHFPRAVADIACEITDVGDRPQKYTKEDSFGPKMEIPQVKA